MQVHSQEATLRFITACAIGVLIVATTGFAVAGQRENLSHPARHSDGCWDLLKVGTALKEQDRGVLAKRNASERAVCDVDGDGLCDTDDRLLIIKILSGSVDFQRKCLVP